MQSAKRVSHPPKPDWKKVARLVLLSRELDLLEEAQLAPTGRVTYQFSAKGHELAQVLLAQALDHPHDAAGVYYRSRPFLLAAGLTPAEALAAGMARAGSPSEGRDVGVVFNLPKRSGPTVLPASGDVGAQYTPAAGWAQASVYRQTELAEADWQGAISAVLGGEGSVATNGFWSALTIAATLHLPMLFFIEDNRYGISVPSSLQTPGGDIAANLSSFKNLRALSGDGTDPEQAWELISEAVREIRAGAGPHLLRLEVPRLQGHTFIDDQAYKPEAERAAEDKRDPLPRLRTYLMSKRIFSSKDWDDLLEGVRGDVAAALEVAKGNADPDPEAAACHLFFGGALPIQGGLRPEGALPGPGTREPQSGGPRVNLIDAVRRTLEAEMAINPRLLVFGEDVGVKGGVHGATLDMQARFGAARVFDTSLSEEGIIGRSVGMALAGLLPVPEIQFRKYADPAHEQISDLGTLRWRTGNKFAAPVVVRVPVGFGKKTGDPWHSVTGEAVYAHTLGWRIAFPSNAADAAGLLRTALRGDDPTFFFEHRALLDTGEGRRPYPGDEYCLPFGAAAALTQGNELTLVTWGAMTPRCLKAVKDYLGRVCVLDLRTIIPWDKETVLESVRTTGKVLIVHEDSLTNGFGAEIAATIAAEAFSDLDAPVERLTTPDIPIPFNIPLMEAVVPSVEKIRAKVSELLAY
jgi:2-oxoisovalerate dehydrogenase E1 component